MIRCRHCGEVVVDGRALKAHSEEQGHSSISGVTI